MRRSLGSCSSLDSSVRSHSQLASNGSDESRTAAANQVPEDWAGRQNNVRSPGVTGPNQLLITSPRKSTVSDTGGQGCLQGRLPQLLSWAMAANGPPQSPHCLLAPSQATWPLT